MADSGPVLAHVGGAPINNPTFTGVVTMPDGSQYGGPPVPGFTTNSPAIFQSSITLRFVLATANNHIVTPVECGYFFRGANRTLIVPFPATNLTSNDGQIYIVANGSAGTVSLVTPTTVGLSGAAIGGTFKLTITGFAQATFNYNDTAATLQTTLSNGVNGPAGTLVTLLGTSFATTGMLYIITVPGQLPITADFTGITGGGGSTTFTTIDNQHKRVLPSRTAVLLINDGSLWYTIGTNAIASTTGFIATASTPAPVSGVAFTPNANQDCEFSFWVNTSSAFTVTYGPTTGAENTLINAATLPVGGWFNKTIPAGWAVIITGTIANLSNITAVTK